MWYDIINNTAKQYFSNPDDSKLYNDFVQLLEDLGYQNFNDIVQSCLVEVDQISIPPSEP